MENKRLARGVGLILVMAVLGFVLTGVFLLGNPVLSMVWLGSVAIFFALSDLASAVPAARQLRPVVAVMILFDLATWANGIFDWVALDNMHSPWMWLGLLQIILSMYVMYVLFTHLGEIATRYGKRNAHSFLTVRNLSAILRALSTILLFLIPYSMEVGNAFVPPMVCICIIIACIDAVVSIWGVVMLVDLYRVVRHAETALPMERADK